MKDIIKKSCLFSSKVYDSDIEIPTCNKYELYQDLKTDSQMLIVEYDNQIYFVFRGTDSFIDVEYNLSTDKISFENVCSVHEGFYEQFISLVDHIQSYVNDTTTKQIIFTGHSLGGALATIASLYFSIHHPTIRTKIYCVTFGSPRVGTKKFKKIYNKHVINSYRFVNHNDPIPKLPPKIMSFSHVHSATYFNNNKSKNNIMSSTIFAKIQLFIRNIFDFIFRKLFVNNNIVKAHSTTLYLENINKHF